MKPDPLAERFPFLTPRAAKQYAEERANLHAQLAELDRLETFDRYVKSRGLKFTRRDGDDWFAALRLATVVRIHAQWPKGIASGVASILLEFPEPRPDLNVVSELGFVIFFGDGTALRAIVTHEEVIAAWSADARSKALLRTKGGT